jgi:hypothetical protein
MSRFKLRSSLRLRSRLRLRIRLRIRLSVLFGTGLGFTGLESHFTLSA